MPDFPHESPSPEHLDEMSAEELDQLPYGVIQLDEDGTILQVNEPEARRAGWTPEELEGKNFFREVAPCADVEEFAGAFREGVRRGRLNKTFEFLYRLDRGDERVIIHLGSAYPGVGWVLATLQAVE